MSQAGEGLKGLTERVIGKKSAVLGQMLLNWKHIVGENISTKTIPLKLSYPKSKAAGATLYLSVKSAYSLEITQYAPRIIERINSFVGYGAVEQIRLIHMLAHSSQSMARKAKKPLSSEKRKIIEQATASVTDETLRKTLQSFGHHIMAEEI